MQCQSGPPGEIVEALGQRVRVRRLAANVSQAALADLVTVIAGLRQLLLPLIEVVDGYRRRKPCEGGAR